MKRKGSVMEEREAESKGAKLTITIKRVLDRAMTDKVEAATAELQVAIVEAQMLKKKVDAIDDRHQIKGAIRKAKSKIQATIERYEVEIEKANLLLEEYDQTGWPEKLETQLELIEEVMDNHNLLMLIYTLDNKEF